MTTIPLMAGAASADFEVAFGSLMQQIKSVYNKPLSARIEEILGSHAAKTP